MGARRRTPEEAARWELSRRRMLAGLGAVPWVGTAVGCKPAPPKTPLAHLYGERWVHGAYELYARNYREVQAGAEQQSFDTYRVLAQRGIERLEALQSRGVPFYVKVEGEEFAIERKVPERLTFTADMDEPQRAEATASWNRARAHLHADYEEIRRLNGALTTLLRQLQSVRNAIEQARIEQYQIVRKLDALGQGGTPPFQLPYQVTAGDYESVLLLLLERLDDDATRLRIMEASIVSVGLVARATDANSGSLSDNLTQVLVAVVQDAEATRPRPADYPRVDDQRAGLRSRGEKLRDEIRASDEYKVWLKAERDAEYAQLGALLSLLDRMTGLPISSVYRQILDIWSGDADYLSYLKTLASFIPGGSQVAIVIQRGIELTLKARDVIHKAQDVVVKVQRAVEQGQGAVEAVRNGEATTLLLELGQKKGMGLLNAQSKYAVTRLERQLSFLRTPKELEEARAALARTSLLTDALPALPARGK